MQKAGEVKKLRKKMAYTFFGSKQKHVEKLCNAR